MSDGIPGDDYAEKPQGKRKAGAITPAGTLPDRQCHRQIRDRRPARQRIRSGIPWAERPADPQDQQHRLAICLGQGRPSNDGNQTRRPQPAPHLRRTPRGRRRPVGLPQGAARSRDQRRDSTLQRPRTGKIAGAGGKNAAINRTNPAASHTIAAQPVTVPIWLRRSTLKQKN